MTSFNAGDINGVSDPETVASAYPAADTGTGLAYAIYLEFVETSTLLDPTTPPDDYPPGGAVDQDSNPILDAWATLANRGNLSKLSYLARQAMAMAVGIASQDIIAGSSYGLTALPFVQPSIGGNVNVTFVSSAWAVAGEDVFVEGGGYYLVNSIAGAVISLKNRGYTGNAAPTTTIPTGRVASPTGVVGSSGAAGASATDTLATATIPITVNSNTTVYSYSVPTFIYGLLVVVTEAAAGGTGGIANVSVGIAAAGVEYLALTLISVASGGAVGSTYGNSPATVGTLLLPALFYTAPWKLEGDVVVTVDVQGGSIEQGTIKVRVFGAAV